MKVSDIDLREIIPLLKIGRFKTDLVLFHHTGEFGLISQIDAPKVFWYFDLVTYNDHYFKRQQRDRVAWMKEALAISDIGFCTDGEWVKNHQRILHFHSHILHGLKQGAHEIKTYKSASSPIDILFVGSLNQPRMEFFSDLSAILPSVNLKLLVKHGDKVFGDNLARLISLSKIVIAPDTPIKSSYWSDRVYVMSGYGGFLLHPFAEELSCDYVGGEEIVFYDSSQDLYNKIRYYLEEDDERNRISRNALKRTASEHTYRHRCQTLLQRCIKMGVISKSGETLQKGANYELSSRE